MVYQSERAHPGSPAFHDVRSCLSRRNTLEQLQSPYRFSQQERIGEIQQYYRDAAKARRLPCPAGSNLMVRIDLMDEQFGDSTAHLVRGAQSDFPMDQ